MRKEWNGFIGGDWETEINVKDFIQKNYTPYTGDSDFLCGATQRTNKLMEKFNALLMEERKKGVFSVINKALDDAYLAFEKGI